MSRHKQITKAETAKALDSEGRHHGKRVVAMQREALVRGEDGGLVHHQLVTRILSDRFGVQTRGGCACAGPYVHRLLDIDAARSEAIRAAVRAGEEMEKPGFVRVNFSPLMFEDEFATLSRAKGQPKAQVRCPRTQPSRKFRIHREKRQVLDQPHFLEPARVCPAPVLRGGGEDRWWASDRRHQHICRDQRSVSSKD